MAEEQIAWTAVKTGEAVVTSDGTNIGKVVEVAALASEDIFHGIVFEHAHQPQALPRAGRRHRTHHHRGGAPLGRRREAEQYEEFEQLHVSRLGLTGIFRWKHFGWKDSNE